MDEDLDRMLERKAVLHCQQGGAGWKHADFAKKYKVICLSLCNCEFSLQLAAVAVPSWSENSPSHRDMQNHKILLGKPHTLSLIHI